MVTVSGSFFRFSNAEHYLVVFFPQLLQLGFAYYLVAHAFLGYLVGHNDISP